MPVYSLYSETREPTAEMLEGLDALVIDLQDVGTRVYTYIYTMAHCMIAAKRSSLPVIVCDRPNPVGGVAVEGPVLDESCTSFVGEYPIPLRHGMTIGELAMLFNEHFGIGAKARGRPHAGLVALDVPRRDRAAMGHAVAEHPDARQRHGLSRHGDVRRHQRVRRPGNDAPVRARRSRRGSIPNRLPPASTHSGLPACTSGR